MIDIDDLRAAWRFLARRVLLTLAAGLAALGAWQLGPQSMGAPPVSFFEAVGCVGLLVIAVVAARLSWCMPGEDES